MYLSVIISLFCLTSGVLSSDLFSPCKVTDLSCIEKSVNAALPQILDGVPELGVESSDPQYTDIIEIVDPIFKLSLINTTLFGYKKCSISNLKINQDFTKIQCNAECKGFVLSGKYKMEGRLLRMPISGNGEFKFTTGIFFVTVDTEVEKVKGDDGKSHVVIKDLKIVSKPVTPVKYEFDNLFDGEIDLLEGAHKYMEENWLEITEIFQYPIWYKTLYTTIKNVNKYLQHVAIEDILL